MATPPSRPALRARYDARRRGLIDQAARVFAQKGYHATSIDDLIAATGMTRGGLYHYTESKRELLLGVLQELMEPLLRQAGEILEVPAPAERQLRKLMVVWLQHVATHIDHMIVFDQERRTLQHEPDWDQLRADRDRFEQILATLLERGAEEGSFAIVDPQIALMMVLGAVNYMPQWLRSSGRLTPAEIAERYCDLLLDGIRAR